MAVQKPEEDIKPLIICKKGPLVGTPEKLVVDVETLSFRPPGDQKLQTARRGKPFKLGNLCGWGGGRGVTKYKPTVQDRSLDEDDKTLVKGDDDIIIDEKTTYNEWLAAQGLVSLTEDQLLQGEICKFYDKGNKSETEHENENEAKSEVVSNETVKDDTNNEKWRRTKVLQSSLKL